MIVTTQLKWLDSIVNEAESRLMTDEVLTPERILDAAQEVLRRFGSAKTSVDGACALTKCP